MLCILCLTFCQKLQKPVFVSWTFSNCRDFNIVLWFLIHLINDDAFVSAATADACFIVDLVCLFMKTHLLALLQDNCLDLVHYAFLRKLSGCVRNITAFCQLLLRPIKSAVLADTDISVNPNIGPIYRPGQYIDLSLVETIRSLDEDCHTVDGPAVWRFNSYWIYCISCNGVIDRSASANHKTAAQTDPFRKRGHPPSHRKSQTSCPRKAGLLNRLRLKQLSIHASKVLREISAVSVGFTAFWFQRAQ